MQITDLDMAVFVFSGNGSIHLAAKAKSAAGYVTKQTFDLWEAWLGAQQPGHIWSAVRSLLPSQGRANTLKDSGP